MKNLRPLIEKLRRERERFEAAAREIPVQFWRTPPHSMAWSAAEVVAHVNMVEILIVGAAVKVTRRPPMPVPAWKQIHLPVLLTTWRGIRVKSPVPIDTLMIDDRDLMLSRLAEQRLRTFSVLDAGSAQDFRKYRLHHPFLGSLNYYDWFRIIPAHDIRHTKQIQEIAEAHKIS